MIERRAITFGHELLAGLELPCFEARGGGDGPHLCLLAGIHGGEYSSIAAVVRFMNALDTSELSGRITAVPIVSMPSFRARSAFVMPQDGKNLNRCFPGSPDGTFSDVLAHHVFHELIAPSDVLLDLHGGDMVEALEPFSLYDESPVEEDARALAVAFGLPYVVRSAPDDAPISGTTSAAAAAAGVAAVIAEAGGCGLLEEEAVQTHLDGLGNALRHLGMLPGEVVPRAGRYAERRPVRLAPLGRGGLVGAGRARRRRGSRGREPRHGAEPLRQGDRARPAPEDGVVLFVTTSPAVAPDGLLLGLGVDLAAI